MKNKKIVYIVIVIGILIALIFALIKSGRANKNIIHITAGNIDYSEPIVTQQIKQGLDQELTIESKNQNSNKEDESKAIAFANEVTFLLLGAPGEEQVDYAEYKKREEEFNKIIDGDGSGTKYQRVGIRYKYDRGPEATRKGIRNRVVKYNDYGKATVIKSTDDEVEVKVYMEDVTVVAYNYDRPQDVSYMKTKMELRYTLKNIYGTYRLKNIKYRLGDDIEGELQDAENKEINNLASNAIATNVVDTKYNNEYDFSKLNEFNEEKQKAVYDNNVGNVVILNAYEGLNITKSATGVLIADGYIATNWNFFEKALEDAQFISVVDSNGDNLEYDGVISIDTKTNFVILKLKEQKKSTTKIVGATEVNKEDAILSIGTKTGYKLSVGVGIVAENRNEQLKNLITVVESDAGGPVYNDKGELIAMNTDESINSSISVANSVDALLSLKEKLDKANFSSIKHMTFNELKEKYYYNKKNEEVVVNQIKPSVWKKFKSIGDIENTISLKLNKANYYKGIVSLRYENEISSLMSGMARVYKFTEALKNSGFKTIYESSSKSVYKNDTYKVTIMEEMGYLIIIMKKI